MQEIKFLQDIYPYFEYTTLILALIFYNKYRAFTFYKYFVCYLITIAVVSILAREIFDRNNAWLFNIYTFFEFNFVALIYRSLLKKEISKNVLKSFWISFNLIYFSSFYFLFLYKLTVIIEALINSIFVILFFSELLKSENILNYKKILPFWLSVGFLIFYLTSIPFFILSYLVVPTYAIEEFKILYSLIIFLHVCFSYGLLRCKSKDI